jgi:hypothetical protein
MDLLCKFYNLYCLYKLFLMELIPVVTFYDKKTTIMCYCLQ